MNIDILNSLTLPLLLAVAGFLIGFIVQTVNRQWQIKDRVAGKRLEIYERIGEDLNRIYCYVMDVGDYTKDDPFTILSAKRNAQRQMNIYQALWPPDTFDALRAFLNSAFKTFQGPGEQARIRASMFQKKAYYQKLNLEWNPEWDERFVDDFGDLETHQAEHRRLYEDMQRLLSRDLMFEERPFWRRSKS